MRPEFKNINKKGHIMEQNNHYERVERRSLYGEEELLLHFSELTDQALDDQAQRMITLLNDPTSLPKHRAQAARIIDHIVFETNYRESRAVAPDTLEGVE